MTIQKFVFQIYGDNKGREINIKQGIIYESILTSQTNKTANQMKTLKKTILPKIALYKALQELGYEREDAYKVVKKYLDDFFGKGMNLQIKKMEIIPGFYLIFKKIMYKIIKNNDNWETEIIKNDNNHICFNIKKCLWLDACRENDCPELCEIFCDVDCIIYGNLKKVEFSRKGTLGKRAEYCDFRYNKKKKDSV